MNLVQARLLVGNPLAYAVQREDGTWYPVREPLTDAVLTSHLRQEQTIGTYVGHGQPTVSRTLVFDIDQGLDVSLEVAGRIRVVLRDMGLPSGLEFSGRKGYHVWVVLRSFHPNTELRAVGRAVLALVEEPGLEVFPKQDTVVDLGNLVKLPGGVHQVTNTPNPFIGPFPLTIPDVTWQRALDALPEPIAATRAYESVESRFPCMKLIQDEGIQEGGRNIQLLHLGSMLCRGGVEPNYMSDILHAVNDSGDPIEEDELAHIIARAPNTGPLCQQLPEDRQCGEYCIRERIKGLHELPKQLANASEGEAVVVRLKSHTGHTVTLTHPDLEQPAKGALKGGEDGL